MPGLQDFIHHWSEGRGAYYIRFLALLLSVAALALLYDLRSYKGFATPEAMDQAQLARNLAEGHGYVTRCIRPFSLFLLQKQANDRLAEELRNLPQDRTTWTTAQKIKAEAIIGPAQLSSPHPDISNPPVYPLVLAGLMMVVPFNHDMDTTTWFTVHQPELVIAIFNQALFFLAVWMLFTLARRLLDDTAAWFSALALLGADLLWQFSVSGLSTMLLLLVFLAVVWCLVWLEHGAEQLWNVWKMVALSAALGGLVGLGLLTRYSFGWLAIPVVIFMGSFLGQRRVLFTVVMLVCFAGVIAPWLVRNYHLTGTFFGTASYSVYEGTYNYPDTRLARSLMADFGRADISDIPEKLLTNLRGMVTHDLPKFGGSWVTAFFLVGLLLPFRNPTLSRLRYFLATSLAVFAVVQCLTRTPLGREGAEVNGENLLVVLTPLVFMYGTALFFVLVTQSRIGMWEVRPVFLSGFLAMAAFPLFLNVLNRTFPVAWPPYKPLSVQTVSRWLQPGELMMSDMPWAVAWYGNRDCIWMPLNSDEDFKKIHKQRAVNALYLTTLTLDNRFLSQWVRGENQGWGAFIAESLLRREVPPGFPLTKAYADLFPEQLLLADRVRWK